MRRQYRDIQEGPPSKRADSADLHVWAPLCVLQSPSTAAAERICAPPAQKDDRPRLLRVTMLQFPTQFLQFHREREQSVPLDTAKTRATRR